MFNGKSKGSSTSTRDCVSEAGGQSAQEVIEKSVEEVLGGLQGATDHGIRDAHHSLQFPPTHPTST